MAFRNIIVESPAHISVKNRQLVIRTDGERSLPIEDISAVLLESNQSTITTAALSQLGQRGSDCRQSYRQCIEMHGESAERGRESPFCVQSMLIQEYF